jgi:hypothetical protein
VILCAVGSIPTIHPTHIYIKKNMVFSVVIDTCKFIIDNLIKENELRFEEKLRISSLLNEISSVLLDTANKLKLDEYPHYNCVLLEKLADNLHFHLIDYVRPQELDDLHSVLVESSQIEKTFAVRKEPDTIPSIEMAAAEFKAMSMLFNI